jgi:hypothetical protein
MVVEELLLGGGRRATSQLDLIECLQCKAAGFAS